MISDTSLASRPVINLVQGHAHDVVDQAIKVISNPAVGIYARGSMLVRVVPHKSPAGTLTLAKQAENVHRPEGSVVIVEVKESSLAEALTRHATFQKWNAKMQPEARNCPVEVARMILDRKGAGWDAIPRLRGVIHAPTLRPDHSVISEPGYDPASGLLFCSDRIWQQQPASPTKQDGKRALEYLARPLSGFPFVSDADRAAALALLITAVLRPALKTAPMFCVTAPAAGTGKSLLVDLASILAIGRTAAVMTPTPNDDEMEKRLGAILLAGDNVLNIDNVSHPLKSDFLCQALTQDEMQVRVLGLSKTARISPTALIAAMQALDRAGVDFSKPLFGTSEALKDIAQRVNRVLDDMDREKIAGLEAELAEGGRRSELDFVSDADRAAYIDEIVDDIFSKLTGRGVDVDLPAGLVVTKRGPLKERTLSISDRLVEGFLEHDIELVGRRYARIMAADIELTERFGSPDMKGAIETIRDEYNELRRAVSADAKLSATTKERRLRDLGRREAADVRDIQGVRDLLRGQYRPELQNTGWARISAMAKTFNYVTALGGVVVSSLTDAVRPAMVHGMKAYMDDGIRPLMKNMRAVKMSRAEAKLAGAISERVLASRLASLAEITDPYSMSSPFERFIQNTAAGFSQATGLLHWNDFQKTIASVMTQNRIQKNAEAAAAKGFAALPAKERAYMGFLGLGNERAENLGRVFKTHGETLDGVRVANTEAWGDDQIAAQLRRAYRAAVNKDVDSIIVTKGAGDTPLLANTPIGSMLLQFKSFALASNQRVLMRGLQEDKSRFVGGVVAMSAMGMLIYALKQLEAGRDLSDNPGTWVAEGLDRSGIFAVAFEANNAIEKLGGPGVYAGASALFPDHDQRQPASRFASRNFAATLAGPSFGTAQDASQLASLGLRGLTGALSGEDVRITGGDVGAARRLTPLASLPYWRWAIDGILVPELKDAVR